MAESSRRRRLSKTLDVLKMNNKIIFFFILFIFYSAHCFGTESLIQSDVNSYISQGERYKAENKLPEALESYQKAIQREPESATAHLGIAKVYVLLRAYDKAIYEFEKSINLEPTIEVSVLPDLIVIYLFRENLTKLKDCLQRLRKKDINVYGMLENQIIIARTYGIFETDGGFGIEVPHPSTPSNAYYELSKKSSHLLQSNRIEKVINIFHIFINDTTVTSVDRAFAYNELGRIYLQYRNPIQGIENLEKAVQIFPNYLYWRQELTSTLISTQLYTNALNETEKILKLSPDNIFGLYAQGIIYNEFGLYDKAVKSWDNLESRDKFVFALAEDSYSRAKSNLQNKNK